jgi:hypothetical protein
MLNQTTAKYQVYQTLTYPASHFIEEGYNLYILGGEILELGKIFHFDVLQQKKKLWGLFKGLKVEEEDIEETKKSLFPEREF